MAIVAPLAVVIFVKGVAAPLKASEPAITAKNTVKTAPGVKPGSLPIKRDPYLEII